MDLKLKNKTVFITGSTSGIGFATAKLLLREGAKVIINGRDEKRLEQAIIKLKKIIPNAKVQGISTDFKKNNEIDFLIKKLPDIDILINNVGVYTSKAFFDTTDAEWEQQIKINVMSGVRLSKYFLPKMLRSNWGRILFISSECAFLVPHDLIPYSATKAAILSISRGLSQITKGTDVTVNTIVPGSTLTEGANRFLDTIAKKKNRTREQVERDFFKNVRVSSLLQRFIAVEEVANTIVYFSSPLSSATNGSVIKVDGGSVEGII